MEPIGAVSGTKNPITLSFAALCAFGILLALGFWQLERRSWKNNLIARFEAGLAQAPSPYRPNAAEFSRVSVTGHYINADTMKLLTPTPSSARGKTKDGFGYQLFTPLKSAGGVVFVNRGFVPESLGVPAAPTEETEVTGLVRVSGEPSWFTPSPEEAKRLFFDADIPAMASVAGLNASEGITNEYIQAEPAPSAAWPQPRDPRELLASIPNNHLQYVFTWFGLAAALAGVYAAYMMRS